MSLTNDRIKERLIEKFDDQVSNFEEPYGMLTFEVPKDMNLKVMQFLYDDDELKFRFLTTLCAVHYPDNKGRDWQWSTTCTTLQIIFASVLKLISI
jgi:NADH-quinone oxidoreductase subunit C